MKTWGRYAHDNYICHYDKATRPQTPLAELYIEMPELLAWIEGVVGVPVPPGVSEKWRVTQDIADWMNHPTNY